MQHDLYETAGVNYCPVATVTPRMQKTPCHGLENGDLWDFISRKTIPVTRGREGWEKERKKIDSERVRERKETQIATVGEKREEDGEKRGKASLAAICSSALDNLGHFCHCISISEQKHLICHSFHFHSNTCKPFAFCQFYLSFSFFRMPLHFLNDNVLAISALA